MSSFCYRFLLVVLVLHIYDHFQVLMLSHFRTRKALRLASISFYHLFYFSPRKKCQNVPENVIYYFTITYDKKNNVITQDFTVYNDIILFQIETTTICFADFVL